MKRKGVALFNDNSNTLLDRNISRLVKLTDDSGQAGRAFTESLINDILNELSRSDASVNRDQRNMVITINQWEKAAAMIAVVCGAGFGIFVYILAHLNTVFAGIVFIVMFVNWLMYFGGLIL